MCNKVRAILPQLQPVLHDNAMVQVFVFLDGFPWPDDEYQIGLKRTNGLSGADDTSMYERILYGGRLGEPSKGRHIAMAAAQESESWIHAVHGFVLCPGRLHSGGTRGTVPGDMGN